eukprot:TRINITY_DN3400_c0_g1_i1.p3 TRINITY_DN3400_c0_g1~~TRINITY_DN3400_c0_g1_i1.p3  ORF type:complete len:139 (-),score=26.02 TRINITY_DN3400_c0_g1_i1:154-570(-)
MMKSMKMLSMLMKSMELMLKVVGKEKIHAICEENESLLTLQYLWNACDSSLDSYSCSCFYFYSCSCFCFDLSSCSFSCPYCDFYSCSCFCSCFVSLTFCASCASRRHSKNLNHQTKKNGVSCAFASFSSSFPSWPSSS